MAGHRKGVAAQILSVEPRALFMNLAMCNTIKNCKLTRDAMHGSCCSWLYREGLVSTGWPVLLRSCTTLGDSAWWLLQLAIEKAWSVLDGPFFIQMSVGNGRFMLGDSISGFLGNEWVWSGSELGQGLSQASEGLNPHFCLV